MELSVIVTRSVHGEIATFPVAENIHKHNILFQSIVPARVDGDIQEKAKELATTLAEKLGLVGTLAVELFLTNEGKPPSMNWHRARITLDITHWIYVRRVSLNSTFALYAVCRLAEQLFYQRA